MSTMTICNTEYLKFKTSDIFLDYCDTPFNNSTYNVLKPSMTTTTTMMITNATDSERLKAYKESLFKGTIVEIVFFLIFQIVGGLGNLFVIWKLSSRKRSRSQMNQLLRHLTIADLMVIFVTITIEVIWRLTISWNAGESWCKIVLTLRTFGLYLSSLLLIAISVDRFFAFVYPMSFQNVRQRNCRIVSLAYLASFLLSLPQAFIYHIERHPEYNGFEQCMSDNYFTEKWKERLYNIISLVGMYFLPLIVVVFCYTQILITLHKNGIYVYSKDIEDSSSDHHSNRNQIMSRAKRRTLKVGIIVTAAFVICWSPYALVVLWYQFTDNPNERVPSLINDVFFVFAVSNSVVNPFVHSRHLFSELRSNIFTSTSTEVAHRATSTKCKEITQL